MQRYEIRQFLFKSKDGGIVKYEDVECLKHNLDIYKQIFEEYIPEELKEEANKKLLLRVW